MIVGPLPPTIGGITTFIKGVLDSDLSKKYVLLTFGTDRPTLGIFKDVTDYTLVSRIGCSIMTRSILRTVSHLLTFPFTLLKNRPDTVHINTSSYWPFWENATYVVISKVFLRKTILHIHGGGFEKFYNNSNYLAKFLIRGVMVLPNRVITLSSSWKKYLAKLMPENKITIVENFVDPSAFRRFHRTDKSINDTMTVLFVGGSEAKDKGLYDAIEAVSTVTKQVQNVSFVFVACSGIRGLETLIEKGGIAPYTRILGYIHGYEKVKVFTESDIFILPSYAEGFPITMIEAMAAGLPVIASSVGAIPEVIQDGQNGFLIKAGDHEALAKRIMTLIKDRDLRKEMARNNIVAIRTRHSKTIILQKLESEYDKLVGTELPT